jgi:molecular chaperone HscB
LHPDRFARAPREVQQQALGESALLNDAYRTLRHPVMRAEYVLRQLGHDGKDLPPGFLEEMFELNMEIEEGGDRSVIGTRLAAADASLDKLFSAWDGRRDAPILREIRMVLNQRRYLENLIDPHV